ncbi:outer membrane beta-barrel family protein [Segatella bryantii]|uniref:outer membrane beta-barrel family protein n=1 Tax=Segatella bryantii TaxID=77095 RepID=UPI001EDACCC4|nr:outer membrane beta-barrel family protein [Segatella bryantii]UKK73008.1 outer membrane beta-barrel family protein [Segatella bryantii]
MMRKKLVALAMLCLFSMPTTSIAAESRQPAITFLGDRTVIYPQELKLHDEESLLDVLLMFPELISSGFEDNLQVYQADGALSNYELRINNIPMTVDQRLFLTRTKASDFKEIRICDHPGVAKGTSDFKHVIDLVPVKYNKGVEGSVEVQGGQHSYFSPSITTKIGTQNTNIFANASYGYQDFNHITQRKTYAGIHLNSQLRNGDILTTALNGSVSNQHATPPIEPERYQNGNYVFEFDYSHDFNEKGTNLLLIAQNMYSRETSRYHYNCPVAVIELNTPILTPNLWMMLGFEADFLFENHLEPIAGDGNACLNTFYYNYYIQLDYKLGKFDFCLGDRFVDTHYNAHRYLDLTSENKGYNHFIASAVYHFDQKNQLQLAYYHKYTIISDFIGETYTRKQAALTGLPLPEWSDTGINFFKLGYSYSSHPFVFNMNTNYFRWKDTDYASADVSATWRKDFASINTGAHYYHGANGNNYGVFQVNSALYLPSNWKLAIQTFFFTKNAPQRNNDNTCAYGNLEIHKVFQKKWELLTQWHDIFSSHYNAFLAGIQYRF